MRNRSCLMVAILVCGLATSAEAQYYSAYYPPSPYATYGGYAPYGFNGPLRLFDWRWWAGTPPYTAGMTYPAYSTSYTAGYQPVSYYSASYAPTVYTAGYFPSVSSWSSAYSAYYTPSYYGLAATTPARSLCCNSCGSGNAACPSGNCGTNYQPKRADQPVPDGNFSEGARGSRKYERESRPLPGTNNDGWKGTKPGTGNPDPNDGFNRGTERGAGYSPNATKKTAPPAEPPNAATPEGTNSDVTPNSEAAPAGDGNKTGAENRSPEAELFPAPAPIPEPKSLMPLVNRDSRITEAPSLLPSRRRMSARFGSPELARAHVNPQQLPDARELRLVSK